MNSIKIPTDQFLSWPPEITKELINKFENNNHLDLITTIDGIKVSMSNGKISRRAYGLLEPIDDQGMDDTIAITIELMLIGEDPSLYFLPNLKYATYGPNRCTDHSRSYGLVSLNGSRSGSDEKWSSSMNWFLFLSERELDFFEEAIRMSDETFCAALFLTVPSPRAIYDANKDDESRGVKGLDICELRIESRRIIRPEALKANAAFS